MAHSPRSSDELVRVLEEERLVFLRNRALARSGSVALVMGLLGILAFLWIREGSFPSESASSLSTFFLVALGGAALSQRQRIALEMAAEDQNPDLTGLLVEALEYPDRHLVTAVETALVKRNPVELAQEQRRILSERLSSSHNGAFVRWGVEVLGRLGNRETIPGLEKLSRQNGRWSALEPASRMALGEIRLRVAKSIVDEGPEQLETRR